ADRNRSHWSTSKTPSYTKSVSWQHYRGFTRLSPSCNSNYLEYIHLLSFCALHGAQISGAFDDQVI
ncbi:hypothetical protein, partial [Escherichia coli]|uniref:hypothetical protein n=1 Tax=Escherichia coli TaxID=562 RepID=UPI002578B9D8